MQKAVRRRVVRFEERLLAPPFDSWGPTRHAVLECGHVHNLGRSTYAPKRMACWDCETGVEPEVTAHAVPAADDDEDAHTVTVVFLNETEGGSES